MTKVVNMLLDTSLLLKWSQTAPKAAFAGLGALSEDSNGPNLPRTVKCPPVLGTQHLYWPYSGGGGGFKASCPI